MTLRRRPFVAAGTAMLAAPIRVLAQAPNAGPVRRIGLLSLHSASTNMMFRPENMRGGILAKAGWIEGENLIVERAFADGNGDRLPGLAQDLLRRKVEVIVTTIGEATMAAARATQTVPIVFLYADWPLEQGLIDSYAHPGRNLTGVAYLADVSVNSKRLQILREIVPAAKRLSSLATWSGQDTLSGGRFDLLPLLQAGAKELGFELRSYRLAKPEDVEPALTAIAAWPAQALAVGGPVASFAGQRVADFALQRRLPTASAFRGIVEKGALLSYAPPNSELNLMNRRAIAYVDRILRGEKPADLPVERPSRYELVLNLKTAKALGITIPQSVLLRADEVIQ